MITDNQVDQLKKLKELLDAGVLTQEEFDQKKEFVLQDVEKDIDQKAESVSEEVEENDNRPEEMVEEKNASVNQGTIVLEDQKTESEPSGDKLASDQEANPDGADQKPVKKEPIYKKKGFIIGAAIVAILLISGVIAAVSGGNNSKTVNDASESDSVEESADTEVEEEPEEEPEVTSIEAQYSGSTEAGTVLDGDNSGITVTATYDDGSTDELYSWEILEPQTLQAGKTSVVTISASGQTCELSVSCTSLTKKQFKKQCKKIPYKKLARDPDAYNGKHIKIYGQVIQVLEEGNTVTLRVATKDSGYGNYYDDVVLVYYEYSDKDKKILEDDMITLWGTYGGTYTYESTMGGNITVPMMYASYFRL